MSEILPLTQNNYVIYVLINTIHKKTYIGITNKPDRRIRQHNGELVGGARYTTSNKGEGKWVFYGFIRNVNKSIALSLEKKIKIRSKKLSGSPIDRRMNAIESLLYEYNNINDSKLLFELL
jgi:predicted GIY-YIG superfamily endonuclease